MLIFYRQVAKLFDPPRTPCSAYYAGIDNEDKEHTRSAFTLQHVVGVTKDVASQRK